MTDENKVPEEIIGTNTEKKQNTRKRKNYNKNAKINAHYFDDLINQIKNKPEGFVEKVSKGSYWKINDKNMKLILNKIDEWLENRFDSYNISDYINTLFADALLTALFLCDIL